MISTILCMVLSLYSVCLPVCLCLLQCIMDPPSLTYPLPAEDEVGYIYLSVCLCVCVCLSVLQGHTDLCLT